jgi:hypothetical protein
MEVLYQTMLYAIFYMLNALLKVRETASLLFLQGSLLWIHIHAPVIAVSSFIQFGLLY